MDPVLDPISPPLRESGSRPRGVVLAGLLLVWSASASSAIFPGPDEFGYAGSEITAVLRDVRATGVPAPLGDDQLSGVFDIGFTFELYGIQYSTFRISSNGFITLGPGNESDGCCAGDPIPEPSSPNNFVAGWWTDLNNPPGNIRFQTAGESGAQELVVGFYDVPHFSDGSRVTFEIVLHEGSNAIEIQCWTCPSDGGFHSTGIENADGSIGLQIASTTSSQPRAGWLISPGSSPDCSVAGATRASIWPPNLKFVEVAVANVTDSEGGPVTIRIEEILQDEALGISPDPISADAWGIGSDLARVRAERRVPGDGRVYHVRFTATDAMDRSCSGTVPVCVPSRPARACTDQGPRYDSSSPPSLESSDPAPGSASVPRTAWIRLTLDAPPRNPDRFELICNEAAVEAAVTPIDGRTVVINPAGTLAPLAFCNVRYTGARGREEFHFRVAAGEGFETISYDRSDPDSPNPFLPFPDDYWLVDDPTTPSGRRVMVEVGQLPDFLMRAVARAVAASIRDRDGFSPIQDVVFGLSAEADVASLPRDERASIDPAAAVGLFDVDPGSPTFGRRIPFTLALHDDEGPDGVLDHTGLLFPAIRLEPGGRYLFVLTRRLHAAGDPSRPFLSSSFFDRVAAPPSAGDSAEVVRARKSIGPALDFLATVPEVPIPREDVALAVGFSIRTEAFDPSDLVAIKEAYLAAPPPELEVRSVTPGFGRAALVEGTVALPLYLDPTNPTRLNRDPATGKPVAAGFDAVPFVLTLPDAAHSGPVPIVFYQHGNPGSPYEQLNHEFLDDAGYAIGGIQDYPNRHFGGLDEQLLSTFLNLLSFRRLPIFHVQSNADMMGFLRAIQGLGEQSWLPLSAPDGVAEIDPSHILYRGISQGANHSLAFLPFAPEITAAASVVGGGRQSEIALHQHGTALQLSGLLPGARPAQILSGLAALAGDWDRQEWQLLARHLYREPLEVNGQPDSTPPSLLWIEGIGDSFVPNNATRAAANELGIPLVRPVQQATPVLDEVDAPLAENLGRDLTAGHFQYDPVATPSCRDLFSEFEGHFCAQLALEAEAQTLHFFETAVDPERPAEIIDPFGQELSLPEEESRARARRFRASDLKQE